MISRNGFTEQTGSHMNEGTGEKYVCNTVQSTVNAAASLSAPAAERNLRAGNADWFAQGSIVWCRDESQPMVQTPLLTHDASPKNVEDMPLISDAEIPGPKDEADLNAMAEDGSEARGRPMKRERLKRPTLNGSRRRRQG